MSKKIQELTLENALTDNHLLVTEDISLTTGATKKTPFSLVKTFLSNLFLRNDKVVGDNINSSTTFNSETNTLTINSKLPIYTSGINYTTDSFVVYNNNLYKCSTAHTSTSTFDETKWTLIGGGINFTELSNMFVAGSNFIITVNTETKKITLAVDGHTVSNYQNNVNYKIGNLVVHENSIYQCNTECTDTEWTASHWTIIGNGLSGANAYVYFKWSDNLPTQDSDLKSIPSNYIGVYSGTANTAPTTYTSYTWYKYKGETGATGTAGNHIYFGELITGTSTTPTAYETGITYANIDDVYISTANGSVDNMYRCTTAGNTTNALWVYVNSIKGDGAEIDDTVTSTSNVWSSNKVNSELANKADKITISSTLTLTVAGWNSTTKTQKVLFTLNTNNDNFIIYDLSCLDMVISSGVNYYLEETTGITFKCATIPTSDITFNVKVTVI